MEYKFRGFDAVGQKGWVYGDLVHNQKVTRTGLEPRVMVGGYEVVPESVGLFTGIENKSGIEIYEGDIVRYIFSTSDERHNHANAVVKWDFARFVCHIPSPFINLPLDRPFEVVGNIFENEDLLK